MKQSLLDFQFLHFVISGMFYLFYHLEQHEQHDYSSIRYDDSISRRYHINTKNSAELQLVLFFRHSFCLSYYKPF